MRPRFNAWKEGLWLYAPWLIAAFVCLVFSDPGILTVLGLAFLVIGAMMLAFFRDPPRTIPVSDNEIVAPADGTIVGIEELASTPHFDGPCRRISIFLSLLDVHINRAPFTGAVRDVVYRPGGFRNAMDPETTEGNESMTIHLETSRGNMTVRQIAGLVARRIVCRAGPGDDLRTGEKFGMIRFGSRTELYLPPAAVIVVELEDKVRAGSTVVARFEDNA